MDEEIRRDSRLSKGRKIGVAVAALLAVFLLGFAPQWLRARSMEQELTTARSEMRMLDLGGRLAAALAESHRGNYERARQLMAGFFSNLETQIPNYGDADEREELEALMRQRDEIITLLSRAEPESTSRLNLMYTRYFAVTHPLGRDAPASVTPSPPP